MYDKASSQLRYLDEFKGVTESDKGTNKTRQKLTEVSEYCQDDCVIVYTGI
jgi:hypothetical protein